MPVTLILQETGSDGKPLAPKTLSFPGDRISIGRHTGCDLVLPEKQVSRRHAELLLEGKTWYLRDLGSGNGSWLNSSRLNKEDKIPLKKGDAITIDRFQITFQPTAGDLEKSLSEITDSDILEVKMIKKILTAMDKDLAPSLEGLTPPIEGKKICLSEDRAEIVIGRDSGTEFPIDDPVISRRHARLSCKWGSIVLTDLKSKNGTMVGTEKITERTLRDGDRIIIGHIKLLYRNPHEINYEALGEKRPAVSPTPPSTPPPQPQDVPAPAEPIKEPQSAAGPTGWMPKKGIDLILLIIGGLVVLAGLASLIMILK